MYSLPVRAAGCADTHDGTDAVFVRARPDRLDPDGVVPGPTRVMEEVGGSAVRGDEDVGRAVVIDVRVGRAARHHAARESEVAGDIRKAAATLVVERERRLSVGYLRLNATDIGLDVTVGDEKVLEPVQVVVEKEEAEGKRQETRAAHR